MAELSTIEPVDWCMPLTAHLGYSPPERRPQFLKTLGTSDLVAHARYAADIGMAGILYPWALDRPEAEVAAIRQVLLERKLGCSAIVAIPSSEKNEGIWAAAEPSERERLMAHVTSAASLGQSLGGRVLAAVLTHPLGKAAGERENDLVAENLAQAAAIAADHGMVIGIEPMLRHPLSMCRSTKAAVALVHQSGSPDVGVIYDTFHSWMMEGDILQALDDCFDRMVLLQLADQPDRVEPGAGVLPLVDVVISAMRRGYRGLMDLEHQWVDSSEEGEVQGFETLREFNEQLRVRMEAESLTPKVD